MWTVKATEHFASWYDSLTDDQRAAIDARVELLQEHGPALRRPSVGEIEDSTIPNLKELRCSKGGALRVLFVFDPERSAVLLVGGDKTGQWNSWYRKAIPEAEVIYREYLSEL